MPSARPTSRNRRRRVAMPNAIAASGIRAVPTIANGRQGESLRPWAPLLIDSIEPASQDPRWKAAYDAMSARPRTAWTERRWAGGSRGYSPAALRGGINIEEATIHRRRGAGPWVRSRKKLTPATAAQTRIPQRHAPAANARVAMAKSHE